MNLTIKIKLLANPAQKDALLRTFTAFNSAANVAAMAGFENKVFSQPSIHSLCYFRIREEFGLASQLAVRAIGKAVECFKRDKKKCPVFTDRSSIVYDERIMRFKGLTHVSLASVDGRLIIPIVIAGYQESRLQEAIKTGQADLVYVKGTNSAIAIEELTGIRGRTRFRKKQRAQMSGWAFHQLRTFIEYKAELVGVHVIKIDPRNTSRTCNKCGHCDKANRKSQSQFVCQSCGIVGF